MKEQVGLKPSEKELLRFVMPVGEYTAELDLQVETLKFIKEIKDDPQFFWICCPASRTL